MQRIPNFSMRVQCADARENVGDVSSRELTALTALAETETKNQKHSTSYSLNFN